MLVSPFGVKRLRAQRKSGDLVELKSSGTLLFATVAV